VSAEEWKNCTVAFEEGNGWEQYGKGGGVREADFIWHKRRVAFI